MKSTTTTILSLLVIIFGCTTKPQETKNNQTHSDTSHVKLHEPIKNDNLESDSPWLKDYRKMVAAGNIIDTSNYIDDHFYYCRVGHFLDKKQKNAVLIYDNVLVLYSYINSCTIKVDSLSGLDLISAFSFRVDYKDFNFDGQKDIYINLQCSNGFPMCYGYLLLVDRGTKKLERHKECEVMANMVPEPKRRIVISDTLLECGRLGPDDQIHKLRNKWINGKLVTLRTDCKCK
jgi:hypothetical protein